MPQTSQGIPSLPDLTHPQELIAFGNHLLKISVYLAIFVIILGVVIALLNASQRRSRTPLPILQEWLERYFGLLDKIPHIALIFAILVSGFFVSATLANRYHHWEQQRIAKMATLVAGERLEQAAPQIRYTIDEAYTDYRVVNGNTVPVAATRKVDKFLTITGSQMEVKINQATNPENLQLIYSVDFVAEYQIANPLKDVENFFFEIRPPYGYSLLQNFQVEQDGNALQQVNPGDYGFPFRLASGEETRFRVTYQAQGAPRWVYNPNDQLVSNVRLTALANFAKADFAGAVPTETKEGNDSRRFTWLFEKNVSVRNPFGVFTATDRVRNTGVVPRLLLLTPVLFLGWVVMLYLSIPMSLRDTVIAAGVFFACILTLTYLSRVMDVRLAWGMISVVLLALVWGLGKTRQAAVAAVIGTIAAGVLPVFGLIVPYSGLTLSIAGLLSVLWLAVRHWYRGYPVQSNSRI